MHNLKNMATSGKKTEFSNRLWKEADIDDEDEASEDSSPLEV
jgi:hypothetical protein